MIHVHVLLVTCSLRKKKLEKASRERQYQSVVCSYLL